MLAIHKRFSVRRAGVLAVSVALLGAVVAPSSAGAWSTDDPTRAVVYQGKEGVADGVVIPSSQHLDTDSSGNVYTLLSTGGELSVGPGPSSTTVGSLASGAHLLTKTDTSGNMSWIRDWSTAGPIPHHLLVTADAVFVTANVYGSMDLDPTAGTDPYTAASGAEDAVVMQFDLDGNYVGHIAIPALASKRVSIRAIAEASDGNVIVAGDLDGDTSFPQGTNPTTYSITSVASQEGFVAKLNRTNGGTDWLVDLTGGNTESIIAISVDADGSVTALGSFSTASALLRSSGGGGRSVTRGPVSDATTVFSVAANGAVTYVQERGLIAWNLLGLGGGAVLAQFANGELHRFDASGQSMLVGQFTKKADSIVRTADGKLRMTGYFNGALDFDIGAGVDARTPVQNSDAFLLTLTSDFRTESVQIFTGPDFTYGSTLATMPDGGFVLAGASTAGTINLSNTIHAGSITSSAGMTHMFFMVRYDSGGSTGALVTAAPATTRYTTGNKKVTVRWSAVPGAVSYQVTTTGGTVKCTSTTTSCEVTGLRNGKMYTYQVRSVNQAGVVSSDATSVRVIPGFRLKTTTFKVRRAPLLSSILTTPSRGAKRWRVTSGSCRISGSRLLMPSRAGSCRLQLSVAKRGSYPAMTTTVRVTVTR